MSVLFRVDAGLRIGQGHISRCFSLALLLKTKGVEVSFLMAECSRSWEDKLTECGFSVGIIETNQHLFEVTRPLKKYEWVVIDHYDLGFVDHEKFYKIAKKVLIIDDLANRQYCCDVLIDPSIIASHEVYQKLVPIHAKIFLGGDYILFSDKILKAKEKLRPKDALHNKCHISLGSFQKPLAVFDSLNLINYGLKGAMNFFAVSADIQEAKKIEEAFKQNVTLLDHPSNIHNSLIECNISWGAPGHMTWERFFTSTVLRRCDK